MSNPNPFVPKGSLLEQQSKRQSRMKIAVTCVLAIGVTSLVAMLIEGCQREKTSDESSSADTNTVAMTDTNTSFTTDTNTTVPPPGVTNTPPPAPLPPVNSTPPETAASVYTIVSGDTLGKIAHAHGVSLKALEAANSGVDSRKLKIGQKINIPSGDNSSAGTSSTTMGATDSGENIYVVKSGDTLHKIAKANGTSVKAIQSANNLTTTNIKKGQKLKIPAKAESTSASVPVTTPAPTENIPAMPPVSAPTTNP
jgi:LysM repeat protein